MDQIDLQGKLYTYTTNIVTIGIFGERNLTMIIYRS